MTDYTLPKTLDNSKDAAYVLNNAPEIIADLRDKVKNCQDMIADKEALVALDNRTEKQTTVKALQQTDDYVKEKRDELRRWEALLERWEKSFASAKYFYKSLLGN